MTSLALSRPKAVLAVAIGAVLSVTGTIWAPVHPAAAVSLAFVLSWAAFIDIDRLILPDALTLGLVVLGLAIRLPNGLEAMMPFAIGAMVGFLCLGMVALAYERFRGKAGLGLGDAKLFAAGGAWLGVNALPSVLLIASASALIWLLVRRALQGKSWNGPMPFGPFLALGIWAELLVGAST